MSVIIHKRRQYYFVLFFLIVFLSFSSFAFAQTSNLSGKVIDEKTKTPLAGATVHIKGSTHEVITNDYRKNGLKFL